MEHVREHTRQPMPETIEKLTLAHVQADYGARRLKAFLTELMAGEATWGGRDFIDRCLSLVRTTETRSWQKLADAITNLARLHNRPTPLVWCVAHRVVEWPTPPFIHRLPGPFKLDFALNFAACCVLTNHLNSERRRFAYMLQLHFKNRALLSTLVDNNVIHYTAVLKSTDVATTALALHARIAKLDRPLCLASQTSQPYKSNTTPPISTLACIASAPHTPTTHALHGPAFRAAVKTLYLCNLKTATNLPSEMLECITKRMSRNAWAKPNDTAGRLYVGQLCH